MAEMSDECSRSIRPRIVTTLGLLLVEKHLGVELLRRRPIAIDDPQEAIRVDLVFELSQQPVDGQHETVGPFGAQVARVENRARRLDRRLDERRRKLMPPQDRLEGRLPGNHGLDGLGLDGKDDVGANAWRGR